MNIKQAIKNRGWTLEKLASQMTGRDGAKGISQAAMSQIINGNPTLEKLKEIALILGISPSELLMDQPPKDNTVMCPHCGEEIRIRLEALSNKD